MRARYKRTLIPPDSRIPDYEHPSTVRHVFHDSSAPCPTLVLDVGSQDATDILSAPPTYTLVLIQTIFTYSGSPGHLFP